MTKRNPSPKPARAIRKQSERPPASQVKKEALARVDSEADIERSPDPSLKQIARVTGVLATHILDAARQQARDPAEHQLDEHRARFGESDTRSISIRCDRCWVRSRGAGSVQRANALATADGWSVSDETDHCPACKDGRHQLGDGSAVETDPVTLTGPEILLMQRIEWLELQHSLGIRPKALIQNSRTSGRRSMLTDLAQRFAYDDGMLMEAVLKLHAAHPSCVPKAFTDPGADVTWLEELFTRLAEEDVPEKERG